MKETLCYLVSEPNFLVSIRSEFLFSFMYFMTKLYILRGEGVEHISRLIPFECQESTVQLTWF